MFKVIEVRFDTLTGNESEHVLLKTPSESKADKLCEEKNFSFVRPKGSRLESFAIVLPVGKSALLRKT